MDRLAETLEAVASTSSRKRKTERLAAWFGELDDADLDRALNILTAGKDGLSVGYSTLREAAEMASGWDRDLIRLCHREVGDSGETISLLLTGKTRNEATTLADAEDLYQRLAAAKKASEKARILRDAWLGMRPGAIKYFIKSITGNFRIGLQAKLVAEALALAGKSKASEAKLFQPVEFMLAKPLDEGKELPDLAQFYVEDKYDGIRSQVHWDHGKVRIFTRGMEEATHSFPEVVQGLMHLPGSGMADGEILAWRDERAMNFTMLQQRLARKKVSAELLAEIPVIFLGYDVLYRDGRLLTGLPFEERRKELEALPLRVSPVEKIVEIDARFAAARARGNEGLMLKRAGSVYETGKRSGNWLKVKRAFATLDVVVTAAEQGTGRRATMLSDYTFAIQDGEKFLNIGKAYSGLTDEEIRQLTRLFKSIATGKYGRVTVVKPEVVLEVAFDGIQKSPRHKSGYALRFPRILRWRTDKKVGEIDTLERVKELYASTLAQ
jgi:DNA ligase 1